MTQPTLARILDNAQAAMVDLDGTMVDTLGDFAEAIARMLQDLALPPIAAAAIEPMVGKGTEHLLRTVLCHVLTQGDVAPGDDTVEAHMPLALERYHVHYAQINGQFSVVYAGVEAGLQALQARGYALACLTNKPTAFANALLQSKGLDAYFSVVFGGDAFARKKPDPLPLLETCKALGVAPQRTVMVGDSSNDARAARAAGCPVVLVTYGYNHGEPIRAVDADAFVDALSALPSA